MTELPRIGLLGIMQELYDEMIPGITEHQAAYAAEVAAAAGSGVADVSFTRPARNQADIAQRAAELVAEGVDGIMIVMLTYGPALRSVRALQAVPVPLLLANIQPERSITAAWTMDDLTYNQGIHGAQDQANALLRAGVPCSIITADWRSESFADAVRRLGGRAPGDHAPAQLQGRAARLSDERHGRHPRMTRRRCCAASARRSSPRTWAACTARLATVTDAAVEALVAEHARSLRDRSRTCRPSATPTPPGWRSPSARCSRRAATPAGRFTSTPSAATGASSSLPLLAASDLMADGYGYAAEGDTNTASLMCAAQTMIGDAHFSEMYAMDWERDSVLISHMGEGNWKVARPDRPVKLIDRPLGIGGLENPPTPVFSAVPGPATTAALIPLEGEAYRLLVGRGEVLDTPELPKVEMHYFHFRPEQGMESFMDQWLELGGPHHFVTNLGDHVDRWRRFAELLELDYEEI